MYYFKFRVASCCLCFFVLRLYTNAQLPAFPTAEGAGKFVTGGRGTTAAPPKVFEVTTLADDAASATTPGTFRYACTNNSPAAPNRIIVFRVAGTIHLYAALSLNRANTTIAGQTAPGEGICIADYPVSISAANMIIRYMRFRLGDKNQNLGMVNGSGNDDAFGDNGGGRQKLMIDHCTAGWSDDESLTIYKGDTVTIQWCMITEPLNYSYHFESGDADFELHSYGGIWGGRHATFHHNLFAHLKGRVPRFDGIRNIPADSGDFRNNVIYNWSDYNTNGGEGGAYNVVNNYYKWGPATLTTSTSGVNRRSMLINPYRQTSPSIPYGKYYLTGNWCDNSAAVTADNWLGAAFNGGSFNDSVNSKVTGPFNCIAINMQTAQEAYASVLADAGCGLPHRDTLDQRIVSDVINRTGRIIDVQGGYPHGTPYSTSQTAWPALAGGTAPADTDHDGMPDVWELQRGLNPASSGDANGYTSTSGYSNIENYLNGDTLVAQGIANTCITAKLITAANTGAWLHANDSTYSHYLSASYLASTDSMNTAASILDNGPFGSFAVSYYTTNVLRYDAHNHPYLNRNITITPSDPSAVTAPVTVRIYFTKAEYDALRAADNSITSVSDLRILKVTASNCLTTLSGSTEVIVPSASGIYGTYQNGYYLQFTTSSFGNFFITAAASESALPVRLLTFDGSMEATVVKLQWRTADEVAVRQYDIERSGNGQAFQHIGFVAATNNPGQNNYLFNDADPLGDKLYYRLKMADKNGNYTYSKTILVIPGAKKLYIAPNPVSGTMTVSHPKALPGALLRVMAVDGKQVVKQVIAAGAVQTEVNVSALPAGMYQVLYTNNQSTSITNFLKK